MAGPDSVCYLLQYMGPIARPHPHAAPGKSRLRCRCSHGSILDHQQLPPPPQIFPELFSSRLLLPRSLGKTGHFGSRARELKADKNCRENGSNVSTKRPRPPHRQSKKKFGRLPCLVMSTPVCKPAMQPFHHHPLKIVTNRFSYDQPAQSSQSL